MSTAAKTFVIAMAAVAAAAALGIGLADRTAAPAAQVVKLERVVVVGQQAQPATVARLPRVVVEQRRAVPREVVVAQAQAPVWIA